MMLFYQGWNWNISTYGRNQKCYLDFWRDSKKNPGMRISSESEEITVKQQEDPYITDMRSVVILLKTMYKDEWLLYSCNNTRIQ